MYIGWKAKKPLNQEASHEYVGVASWCRSNGATIEDKGDYYECVKLPEPTAEEVEAQALAQAKAGRADAVSKIIVEVDGMKFDGDETSQQRMARSIVVLEDGETMPWVLYDNTIAEVSKEQLAEALRLAGDAQTALWTVPYTDGERPRLPRVKP